MSSYLNNSSLSPASHAKGVMPDVKNDESNKEGCLEGRCCSSSLTGWMLVLVGIIAAVAALTLAIMIPVPGVGLLILTGILLIGGPCLIAAGATVLGFRK